jgi:Coenzyme PQQ synthesis protein D (PqqD)
LKPSDKISISPQVVARELGGETVILDLSTGTYFGLDPVGARMWRLLEAGQSLAGVCDAMVEEFEVSRDELERDVLALARDLLDKKLITVG